MSQPSTGSEWIGRIRSSLLSLQPGSCDTDTISFFHDHYRKNSPTVIQLPDWPAFKWGMADIANHIGLKTQVEVQWGRARNPRYELESMSLKTMISFEGFLEEMLGGEDNSTYLTAQNTGANRNAFSDLWRDVTPLPPFLTPYPETGFFWLGRDTTTPLHHDETNNLMCQVMGRKLIRLFAPEERNKLDPSVGVHSRLGWVTDQMIYERNLNFTDVWLEPGQALFLPIGWWHCVKSYGVALTLVYTNFIWENFWGRVN